MTILSPCLALNLYYLLLCRIAFCRAACATYLPYHSSPLLSCHRLSPCAAPLSCWLVVASPPLLLRHYFSCAGWLLNCHLSSHIQIKRRHHGGPAGHCLVLPICPLSTNLNGCGSPIIARERGCGENKKLIKINNRNTNNLSSSLSLPHPTAMHSLGILAIE